MSRKLLQVAGAAAFLAACGIFFQEAQLPNNRALVPESTPTAPKPHRDFPGEIGTTAVPLPATPVRAVDASLWIEAAIKRLPSLSPNDRITLVNEMIARLRAAGPLGLQTVAEFLRGGRDVSLREGYGLNGSAVTSPSTLRVALLNALADWEGSASVLLDFLKSPASTWELVLAIRNLELQFPSTYRAESTAALKAVLARPEHADFGEGGEVHLFATVARLEAKDLLPQVEAIAIATSNVPRYVEMLSAMPVGARVPALQAVFARPEVAAELEAAPQTIGQWSLAEPGARAFLADLMGHRLLPVQRVAALEAIDATPNMLPTEQSLFSTKQNAREMDRAAAKAAIQEAEARKAFLAGIANDKTQPPEVQSAAKDAQRRVTADLAARQTAERAEANPLLEVDFAIGTGKAQIKGRRIEAIELGAPAVVQPAPSEDSTDSPDR